jgi:hypothetical protein
MNVTISGWSTSLGRWFPKEAEDLMQDKFRRGHHGFVFLPG